MGIGSKGTNIEEEIEGVAGNDRSIGGRENGLLNESNNQRNTSCAGCLRRREPGSGMVETLWGEQSSQGETNRLNSVGVNSTREQPVGENVREMANSRQDGWTLVKFVAKMSAPEMDITFGAYSSDG